MAIADISTSLALGVNAGLGTAEGSALGIGLETSDPRPETLSAFDQELATAAEVLARDPMAFPQQTTLTRLVAGCPGVKHLKTIAASATFAATSLVASSAAALEHGAAQSSFNPLWLLSSLSVPLAELLNNRHIKNKIVAEEKGGVTVFPDGRLKIGNLTFDNFDTVVAFGKKQLESDANRSFRIPIEGCVAGAITAFGSMWVERGDGVVAGAITLIASVVAGFAAITIPDRNYHRVDDPWDKVGYRNAAECSLLAYKPDDTETRDQSITARNIAEWVGVILKAAEETVDGRISKEYFDKVLSTGRLVRNERSNQTESLVELIKRSPTISQAIERVEESEKERERESARRRAKAEAYYASPAYRREAAAWSHRQSVSSSSEPIAPAPPQPSSYSLGRRVAHYPHDEPLGVAIVRWMLTNPDD